jgi:hypothetical protein
MNYFHSKIYSANLNPRIIVMLKVKVWCEYLVDLKAKLLLF